MYSQESKGTVVQSMYMYIGQPRAMVIELCATTCRSPTLELDYLHRFYPQILNDYYG